jgi:pyruvate, water dikinase
MAHQYVAWFRDLRMTDVNEVGGKNASLGEMISQLAQSGVRVPGGFATTAFAFREFLQHNHLEEKIEAVLSKLDADDVNALAQAGGQIRQWVIAAPFQPALQEAIATAYQQMLSEAGADISVAVRSSATAEDLPDASFAGQQETYLNIHGLDNILIAVKHVFASLYNDRAISYRVHKGFVHSEVALSAGIQRMVRSDIGAAGVMFTLDTESGFKEVVFITSSYGLGETVVQGAVNPDEFYVSKVCLNNKRPAILRRSIGSKAIKMVFGDTRETGKSTVTLNVPAADRDRFSISDAETEELARYAVIIEKHYDRPMDIEWGRDGVDGKLYILQARPETVKSQGKQEKYSRYRLLETGEVLSTGRAIGQKIGAGTVRIIMDSNQMDQVKPGDILVTDMTDPNWEPVMKRASAIVTNRGGRTCHAAIIARELGVPAIVGCGDATEVLKEGSQVTVSCAEGDTGNIYRGNLKFEILNLSLEKLPELPVKIMMNVGNGAIGIHYQRNDRHASASGVGLSELAGQFAQRSGKALHRLCESENFLHR